MSDNTEVPIRSHLTQHYANYLKAMHLIPCLHVLYTVIHVLMHVLTAEMADFFTLNVFFFFGTDGPAGWLAIFVGVSREMFARAVVTCEAVGGGTAPIVHKWLRAYPVSLVRT